MNDSRPVRAALAAALTKNFNGARVTVRDETKGQLRSESRAGFERFEIERPDGALSLDVSDDQLATLSNTHRIEEGHRYASDDELGKVLVSEMQQAGVLERLQAAKPGDVIQWVARTA